MEQISESKKTSIYSQLYSIATVVTGLAAFVTDFLNPLGPYTFYLALLMIFILIISVFLRCIPSIHNKLITQLSEYWYRPVFFAFLLSTALLVTSYSFSKSTNSSEERGTGYLAGSFEELRNIQLSLLNIEQSVKTIEKNTREIADTVKKETSFNPRKELANLGVDWDKESFVIAATNQDQMLVQLFAKGGMSLSSDYDVNHIFEIISYSADPTSSLDLLIKNNALKVSLLNTVTDFTGAASFFTIASRRLEEHPQWFKRNGDFKISPLITAIWKKDQRLIDFLITHGASPSLVVGLTSGPVQLPLDPKSEAKKYGMKL